MEILTKGIDLSLFDINDQNPRYPIHEGDNDYQGQTGEQRVSPVSSVDNALPEPSEDPDPSVPSANEEEGIDNDKPPEPSDEGGLRRQ